MTHAEACARAHAFARALQDELGLQPGDRVAVMLQNVPELVLAIHAVWLAGGIVTTVNPMNKERELRHQLGDAGVRVVVCAEEYAEVVGHGTEGTPVAHVVTVPGAYAALEAAHAGARVPAPATAPGDPALLTYTSGTTGLPKGVINTHGGLLHNARAMTAWGALGPGDVTVALAPIFHITGLVCHLATAAFSLTPLLLAGRFEAGAMLAAIERHGGTYAIGPLTAYIAMLEHPDFPRRETASLSKLASGGAPVYPAVVQRWEAATGVYIHNAYGLTETTAPTHIVPRGRRAPVDPGSGALSVGLPLPGTEARLARGAGEILERGPTVTPGYWQRPQETAAALEDGWLHTGDVGVLDAEGWLYLVDRLKDMIIVSGYKVWPREVEAALMRHPAVLEASVVGAPDPYRGETVVAFVAPRPGATVDAGELLAHAREQLAVYKAPRRIELVDEIPKTLSGKALRRELRERAAR